MLKGILLLLSIILLLLAASIPISILAERPITLKGDDTKKKVFRAASILPMSDSDQLWSGESTDTVIKANLLPIDSNYILYDHSIFIKDGIIEAIVPDSLANFEGYQVHDLGSRFVMPGLIDMHAHVLDRKDLGQYLSYGVTTVRNMMGMPMHLRWKRQINKGALVGSRLITASPTLNSGKGSGPFHKRISGVGNIQKLIERYERKGYDFIKIYNGLSDEQFESIQNFAHRNYLYIAGHPPKLVGRSKLLKSGIRSFEHIEEVFNTYMERKINDSLALVIAREFAENEVPICLTLSAYHHLYRTATEGDVFTDSIPKKSISPFLRFVGKRQTSGYKNLEQKYMDRITKKDNYLGKLSRIFYDEGVPIVLGTDTGPNLTVPGATLHDEIELMEKLDIPPYEIIYSGTKRAAQVLGYEYQYGSIEVGKRAELIVVDQNPLLNLKTLREPKGIYFNSIWFDEEAVKKLREKSKRKTGWFLTLGKLLEHLIVN